MNVVGIIAEYNPMHNGHIYNIQKAKELTGADYVIVIMSGSFTEQGNIAVINKFDRATLAIQNGADLVIELPTIFAISSAENFAYGAVNILNSLGIVTHLAFGAESNEILPLQQVANTYLKHKKEIIAKIKEYTRLGINSAEAYNKSLTHFLKHITCDVSLPNNILGIEYLKALTALKSEIKPVLVHRQQSNHSDNKIPEYCQFASSTSIRNVLTNNTITQAKKLKNIKNVVPKNTLSLLSNNIYNTNQDLWNILKYEILKLNIQGLKQIHEVGEGLENKLYKNALTCNSYEQYIFSVKSKRYTLSKIKRICIYIILGITKEKYNRLNTVNYARILKVNKASSQLLSAINNNSNTAIITKITDKLISSMDENIAESLRLDILSHNISNTSNMDYINKIMQP